MKNILVPTDYSKAAKTALQYAIEISKRTGATITCFHSFTYSENVMESFEIAKAKVEKKLQEFIDEFNSSTINVLAYPDSISKTIEFISTVQEIDLIIMGTGAEVTMRKILVGSNASHTLFATNIPILIAPENVEDFRIRDILYASDLKPLKNKKALNPIKELAVAYNATVTIAHVQTNIDDDYRELKELEKENKFFGSEVSHVFKYVGNEDIGQGIRYFINYEACDLLVMVRREYGFFDQLFKDDYISEFAENPELPVLIIHE